MNLNELLHKQPVLPFIRESDYAVRQPWHMPERRLLDYLLIYFQEGHCRFEIDGDRYDFYTGDYCLVQPGSILVMHGLTQTVTPFAHMDVFYHPRRLESFPTRAGQTDLKDYMYLMQPKLNDVDGIRIPVKLQPKNPEHFATTLLKMVECWQNPHPLRQIEAQSLAMQLVVSVLYDHTNPEVAELESLPAYSWLPSFLSLHLDAPISVDDMAKRANLSVSRFREVFKHNYGMPPHQYLLNLRIGHAKELLQNTKFSIEKVAGYCGFADIHHFSKAFKKIVGTSPSGFRNTGGRQVLRSKRNVRTDGQL